MELIDFINKYWTILSGILSFIGVIFYMQFKVSEMTEKNNKLETRIAANEIKVDSLKDRLGEMINLMQQDIREIMTILKRDK